MELTWYGLSCFKINERGLSSIVTDPYDAGFGLELPRLKADIVTQSNDSPAHNNLLAVNGVSQMLAGPGEYEIGGVFITGVGSRGKERNTSFRFDLNGLTVVHVGRMTKLPSQARIEALGEVNVLLLPVGGGNRLNGAQAAELVAMIEPGIVVPMHYAMDGIEAELEGVERFLNEMGSADVEPTSSLRLSKSNVPEETQTVLLTPKL